MGPRSIRIILFSEPNLIDQRHLLEMKSGEPAVVAELVSALSSLERYTILKGRGFEPGRIFFDCSISRFKRLIEWSSNRYKYVRTRMRMRGSRKRLLRMRETSIFGLEREFDFLGGL